MKMEGIDPEECVRIAQQLIPLLVVDAYSTKVFSGRWQTIRSKLEALKDSIASVAESSHWVENLLMKELLPNIVSTLQQTRELAKSCTELSYSGKLLMQSDLDVVVNKLNLHLRDLDLLLKSGVLRESNAIVVSWPGPGASGNDVAFFVKDLFTRLQIGNAEFKEKALNTLVRLLQEDDTNIIGVENDGDIRYLVQLLDSDTVSIREQAAVAVSILAQTDSCKACLVAEGVIAPLIRLLESGSPLAKERAAESLQGLTMKSENAWAVSAYGGVSALIKICRCGSPEAQSMAAGALRNLASVEEIRLLMVEESAIPVLVKLVNSGTSLAQEFCAECLHILAANDEKMRQIIAKEGGIQSLLLFLESATTPKAQEIAFGAIHSLSASLCTAKLLISSGFLRHLTPILKSGHSVVQHLAASAICNLSQTDETKKALGEAGCIPLLVKMLDGKASPSQDMAAQALSSLLVVQTNRKEFIKDEKSVSCLVQLIDPENQTVSNKFPLSALLALSSSNTCRKKIVNAGACQHLEKLAEMEVAGAKKILQKISGGRLRNIFSRKWRN
eukprot:Gb_26283 [translate_table: standard]